MNVLKKKPTIYKAVQWNGYNREDYIKFLKELNWFDGFNSEYYDNGNKLIILESCDYGADFHHEVKERGWIVFDYNYIILTDKEFKEQYEEVKQ